LPEWMDKEQMVYDVIIAGAGPVGLSLAISLANLKLNVAVFEKNASTSGHSRAASVWPGTLEVLARLGVIDSFLKESIRVKTLKMYDADNERFIYEAPIKDLQDITGYPELLIIPQSLTEKLLLQHLQKMPGVSLFFSCEVTDVVQTPFNTTVTYTREGRKKICNARIVVGADGARSTIREKIGATFKGKTYPLKAALADVVANNSGHLHPFRLTTRKEPAIAIRIRHDKWRLIMPFRNQSSLTLKEQVTQAAGLLLGNVQWHAEWESEFSIHNKISSVLARGRIVLAGDAGHVNSPVGGQGMNAGIQDVPPLTSAIEKALKTGNMNTLEKYSRKRETELRKGVNRFTDILTRILVLPAGGRLLKPFLHTFNLLLKVGPIRKRILKKMAMLS
jgi:3-(3-hydroxy-phenyl)propionate hydroxylase